MVEIKGDVEKVPLGDRVTLEIKEVGGKWHIVGRFMSTRIRQSTGLPADKRSLKSATVIKTQIESEIIEGAYTGKKVYKLVFTACDEYLKKAGENASQTGFYKLRDFAKRFGQRRLATLTQEECQKWFEEWFYDDLKRKWKWKPSSMATETRGVQSVLSNAFLNGHIRSRIKFVFPKVTDGRTTHLSLEQTKELMEKESSLSTAAPIFSFMASTGSRLREAIRLKWEDVDLDRGQVNLASLKGGGGWRKRSVPLMPAIVDKLRAMPRIHDQVFLNFYGRPYNAEVSANTLAIHWKRIREALNFGDVKIHDLRHTFASILADRDVDTRVIADLLGHTNIQRASQYAHLKPSKYADAVNKMGL